MKSHPLTVKTKLSLLATAVLALGMVPASAASLQVLKSMGDAKRVALTCRAPLLRASDGMLYGTTERGGTADKGTVFRLREDGGGFEVVFSFSDNTGTAQMPRADLLQASDGLLYGTTVAGGSANMGTVFKMAPDGSGYAILHHFQGTAAGDGRAPAGAALVQAGNGLIYGSTPSGLGYWGTLFRLATDGSGFATIHQFQNTGGDGTGPTGPLTVAPDGMLYGATGGGGAAGKGTVFRIAPDGTGYSRVYDFQGGINGQSPRGLIRGLDGLLYGTTAVGGTSSVGIVFKLATDGTGFTKLHDFLGTAGNDGASPLGGLVQGPDGVLYGITSAGGLNNLGCAFKLNSNGSGYLKIHDFGNANGTDAKNPQVA